MELRDQRSFEEQDLLAGSKLRSEFKSEIDRYHCLVTIL